VFEIGLGQAGKAEDAHEPIERQGRCAHHLGQAPGAAAPHHVHLPKPVLCMHVAECDIGIVLAIRSNCHDAVRIAQHLHRIPQRGDLESTLGLREGAAQPEISRADGECEQQHQGPRSAHRPDQGTSHHSLPV
jgi:hypothetical protein